MELKMYINYSVYALRVVCEVKIGIEVDHGRKGTVLARVTQMSF
jgi:hypothetical protein